MQTFKKKVNLHVKNNMDFQKENYFAEAVVSSTAWLSTDYHL